MTEEKMKERMPIVFSIIVESFHAINKKVEKAKTKMKILEKEARRLKKAMIELGYLGVDRRKAND